MNYLVRRFRPEDEDALFAFRKKIFPAGSKNLNSNYFRWKFLEHPGAVDIPFFLLESDDRIVGTQGYWPLTLMIGSRAVTCGQLVDFNVDEAFRGMPVLKLFKAVCSETELNFGANLSKDARLFFRAARWDDMSTRLNNHYLYLRPPYSDNAVTLLKHYCGYTISKVYQWNVRRKDHHHFSFEISDKVPPGLESFLNSCPDGRQTFFMKNLNYYLWRYSSPNRQPYHFVSLSDSGTLKAVSIIRLTEDKGLKECHVMDIISGQQDPSVAENLLCEMISWCERQGDVILITATSLPSLNSVFKACGFRTCPSVLGFMVNKSLSATAGDVATFDNLNFMLGDTDLL